jgi:O-antigen/teichoic acid export membrane protein
MTHSLIVPFNRLREASPGAVGLASRAPILTLADQLLLSAANFAISFFLARCAAPEILGQYALAFLIVCILGDFHRCVIWHPMAILSGREDRGDCERRFRTTVRLSALLGLGAAATLLCVAGVARLLVFDNRTLLGIGILLAPVLIASVVHEIQRRVNFSLGQPQRTLFSDLAYAGAIATLLSAGLAAHVYRDWSPSAPFGLAALLGGAVMGILAGRGPIARLRRSGPSPRIGEVVSRHWPYARWNLAATTMQLAVDRMAIFVLSFSAGLVAVANFEAGRLLAMPLYVIVMGLYSHCLPALAERERMHGRRKMVLAALHWSLLQLLLAIGFAGALWLGAERAGTMLFHRDYGQIATISAAWSLVIGSFGVIAVATTALGLLQMQRWAVWSRVPSALLVLALLLPAIERGGEAAVAALLAVSGLLSGLLMWVIIAMALRGAGKKALAEKLTARGSATRASGSPP